MLSSSASAQFVITTVIALATAIIIGVIVVTVSLPVIRASSVLLVLLLLSMFLVVAIHVPDSFMWVSLMNRSLDRTQFTVNLLFYWGTAVRCLTAFYDCCTIGILARKSLFLAFPSRDTARDLKPIVVAVVLTTVTVVALLIATDVLSEIVDLGNFDKGACLLTDAFVPGIKVQNSENAYYCNNRSCLYGTIAPGSAFFLSTTVVCFLFILVLGGVFLLLTYKRQTSLGIAFDRTINRFIAYLFVFRFLFEIVPFFLDLLIERLFHVKMTAFLGPFPKLGIILDSFLASMVYYVLLGQRSSYGKTTKVTSAFTLDRRSTVSPHQEAEIFRMSVTKL